MTDEQARTAANVVLASVGVAAAYVILTTPSLRRLALRATRLWLGASVPVYVLNQVRQAWMQSART
ncbi:MAG TPA: hypothetical protein VG222_14260 [Vicinamibacterales bacterium]|nr:hypothetical protein [Vicinamibacterales bacterium]